MAVWRNRFYYDVVDPLVSAARRVPASTRLAEFRVAQWDDVETARHRQDERLAAILTHASTRVPFYRERVRSLSPESIADDPRAALAAFPILERDDIRNHLDELTCEMGRGTMAWSTGGSTGKPVRFRRDRHYLAAATASKHLFFEWAGIKRGDRHVCLWGARHDFLGRNPLARRTLDLLHARTMLDAHSMTLEQMREYAAFLTRRPVDLLEGYANNLDQLAQTIEREGLAAPRPRAIVSTASMLLPRIRTRLERIFSAPVFDRYGCREVGSVAAECDAHEGLHVLGETTVLGIVDADGRQVDEGESGDVLLTNLWNYTMPFIRYRVGDQAARGADRCSCGRPYPMLASIRGRTFGGCVRRDGTVALQGYFPLAVAEVFDADLIDNFQIVQETVDVFTVRVVLHPGVQKLDARARDGLTERIRELMCAPCRLDFEYVDRIEPTSTGKHLYSVSNVARPAATPDTPPDEEGQ
jgi:phenylacetate-CoA ligase